MVEFPDIIASHPLHPSHQLKRDCFPTPFTCNGCNTRANGYRYHRSNTNCNFNLHELCATCPSKLLLQFFMHRKHQLKLQTPRNSICLSCDICQQDIEDESEIFYTCKANNCSFNIHPLCSRLPHYVDHRNHRVNQGDPHQLELRNSKETQKCRICNENCSGWRYSCDRGRCKVDINIECITSMENGSNRWNMAEILRSLGVKFVSLVATSVLGPVVGQAMSSAV